MTRPGCRELTTRRVTAPRSGVSRHSASAFPQVSERNPVTNPVTTPVSNPRAQPQPQVVTPTRYLSNPKVLNARGDLDLEAA